MRTIQEIPLTQSFRSTKAILGTVDKFFSDTDVINISNFSNNTHKCFRTDAPGAVEIHKLISKQTDEVTVTEYEDLPEPPPEEQEPTTVDDEIF